MSIHVAAIVAMSTNNAIGKNNVMPWHIPSDLKRVKQITMGKPCIMGRKTFESILSYLGKPLPGRTNIVVSRQGYDAEGILPCASVEDALDHARAIAERDGQDEIIIFGGAQIYHETLPLLDRIHLTLVHGTYDADAFFPTLNPDEWVEIDREDHLATDTTPPYSYITLQRQPSLPL